MFCIFSGAGSESWNGNYTLEDPESLIYTQVTNASHSIYKAMSAWRLAVPPN